MNVYKQLVSVVLFSTLFLSVNSVWGNVAIGTVAVRHLIAILGLFLIVALPSNILKLKFDRGTALVFAFVLYCHLNSVLHGQSKFYSYGTLMQFLIYFNVYMLGKIMNKIRRLLKMLVIAVMVMMVVGCIEILLGQTFYAHMWQGAERTNELGLIVIGSTVASPNYMSLILVPLVPIVYYLKDTSDRRHIYYFIISFFLLFVFILFSRAGIVLIFSSLGMLLFKDRIKRRHYKVIFYLLITSASFIALIGFRSDSFLANILGTYNDDSIALRSIILVLLLSSFAQHPLFGIGFGNFKNISLDMVHDLGIRYDIEISPMNSYLGTLAELGIVGAIFMFIYLQYFFMLNLKGIFQMKRKIFVYFSISLILLLVNMFVIDAVLHPILLIMFALINLSWNRFMKVNI